MVCFPRRRAIASKFDLFVINETHVQSACIRHRKYVTQANYVKMSRSLCSFYVYNEICIQINFRWENFCLVTILYVKITQICPASTTPVLP